MHALIDIVLIAVVGAIAGLISIPFGFHLNSSPFVVYFGNALGSLIAVIALLYFTDRFLGKYFTKKLNKRRIDQTSQFINRHGVRLFGVICPFFPGVTISVPAAFALKLDMRRFKTWMYLGIFVVSAGYVFSYYVTVVK